MIQTIILQSNIRNHFITMAIAHHGKKILFIHIPKNAGASISKWLVDYGSVLVDEIRHSSLQVSDFKNSYYSFCVVRNPWDRMISLYHYGMKVSDETTNFNEWLKKNYQFNRHWYSVSTCQVEWIQHEPNLIIRYENLGDEFEIIRSKFNSTMPLPTINKTLHQHYSTYYDDWSRNFVGELYSKDIERFNYQFAANK